MDQPFSFVTAEEFSEAFQSFHVGIKLGDELGTEFDKSKPSMCLDNQAIWSRKMETV
jgi:hypothetical protein